MKNYLKILLGQCASAQNGPVLFATKKRTSESEGVKSEENQSETVEIIAKSIVVVQMKDESLDSDPTIRHPRLVSGLTWTGSDRCCVTKRAYGFVC